MTLYETIDRMRCLGCKHHVMQWVRPHKASANMWAEVCLIGSPKVPDGCDERDALQAAVPREGRG